MVRAHAAQSPVTRTLGFWLAVPLAVLQAFNAVRAVADPVGFSAYMGAPLQTAVDSAWVLIYALRTGFIALLVAQLLLRRDLEALKWTALVALIMPLGDAFIAHQAGAASVIVARHGAIAAYLLVVTVALFWSARGRAR
ncbi:MAG: DUF4267 domain-containing protein [Hyphomonadaceae bacterium]|nr:DUF4267 domain-containing protein [Hyphomonadaceae bacterium]